MTKLTFFPADSKKKRKKRRRRKKKTSIITERFASQVIIVIGISTAIFIVAQYISFLVTREEQTVLIEKYFQAVVIECGVLMLKRITELIVAKVKKKEGLTTDDESED